jgi:hypothetical protein
LSKDEAPLQISRYQAMVFQGYSKAVGGGTSDASCGNEFGK